MMPLQPCTWRVRLIVLGVLLPWWRTWPKWPGKVMLSLPHYRVGQCVLLIPRVAGSGGFQPPLTGPRTFTTPKP